MDKNAIKKYAIWARRELIEKVSQKALQFGIEDGKELDIHLDSVNGILLTDVEKRQRQALISKIKTEGYNQVMEEVAYTWFNRFIAIRFMEVNGYLPSHIRVFTDDNNNFKPQIIAEALHLEFTNLNKEKIIEMKQENQNDKLFKYLLISQCNELSDVLPRMFQKISDYTELLLPDYLLRAGSVIDVMISDIPQSDWRDQVQIIGWLYQYYNTEPKDKVFADLKKNVKITKETIPAATQLFTPDWIVHYMVENSLGRLWLEGHPNESLKGEWKYYLNEAEQEPNVQRQLEEIRKEYVKLNPQEIKCIDPCMGSGHILCVLFDTLIKIYEDYGYPAREAAACIVEYNLWGLDIDERAAQLAYFAVMMKARQYDRRFLTRGIQPHVYAIEESNGLKYDGDYGDFLLEKKQQEILTYMFDVFKDAKEYGSILAVEQKDYDSFLNAWNVTSEQTLSDVRMMGWYMYVREKVYALANQAKTMSQKYHVVVTNPPYMGSGNMGEKLSAFVKDNYPDTKVDMSTVFMEKCIDMSMECGYVSMINIPVWMTLAGCVNFREKLIKKYTLINMLHNGRGVFGSDFGSTSFVYRKKYTNKYIGAYRRLFIKQGAVDSVEQKEKWFFEGVGKYYVSQDNFLTVPGFAFAYNVGKMVYRHFEKDEKIGDYASARQGLITGDNDRFMRFWYEVDRTNMSDICKSRMETDNNGIKWYPYNKGGDYRKWYGNNWYVVDWSNDGYDIQHFYNDKGKLRSRPQNMAFYFKGGLTWTALTAGKFSMRLSPKGYLFDAMGPICFPNSEEDELYILGLLNSSVGTMFLRILCPNLKFDQKPLESVPIVWKNKDFIISKTRQCVEIAKDDWNSSEISWQFEKHPFLMYYSGNKIEDAAKAWNKILEDRRKQMKCLEEDINRLFSDAYEITDNIAIEVEEEDITLLSVDLRRDIVDFISYAVGCMFGRYSIDEAGLIYAGGDWDDSKYNTFIPDNDAIIPICDDEYFSDDIVARFSEFVEVLYGKEFLEDNLAFIARVLGGKGSVRDIIRNYFISDFYKDHCAKYSGTIGKRPIYWLFDSGKKNGFKCLVYMHRYQPDTLARIRTDYIHEQQARYRTAIEETTKRIESTSGSDKVKLTKKLNNLKAQNDELHVFEEKIHHLADQMISIDLDDGVKKNYEIFKDVLAKIK